jgi:predicted dehydrogenase
MNTPAVRVALVGVANHGTTILNAIRAAGNLTLRSCYDINTAAAEAVAAATGARPAASYDDLLADADLDAVALVTPNHLHEEQLRKAVAAGKHVFVDKPIANDIAPALAMIRLAREAKRVLLVGHNTRRRQVFRRAKELLDAGTIGTPVAVEGNLSRPAGLQPGLPPWKADPRTCPLLPMMQLGIHLVDTIAYLLGPIDRVSCIASTRAMPGSVYDATAALLQLASGVPCALSSYYVSPDAYFLRIYGTRGMLHCTPTHMRIDLLDASGNVAGGRDEDFPTEGANSYMLQMREFGECILHGTAPETDGDTAVRALAAIVAMTRSVETRSTLSLTDLLG